MRRFFQSLFTGLRTEVPSKLSKRINRHRLDRKLRLESLENRRVLATVTGFTPTASGFNVQLSEQIDVSKLNLYTTEGGAMGAADVTVTGASTGNVKGSLIVSGTTLSFVATGGPLAADTYTVTLRSAADAFTDLADGGLLDGEFTTTFPSGNGTAGGNFVTTFSVSASQSLVVSLPDFARGPTQAVNVPAVGSGNNLPTGLPIGLSNAAGVTSLTMTLQYDTTLLNITDAQVGSDAPTGSQVQANFSTPGQVTLSFFSLQPLAAGQADIINLIATVPETAAYGSAGVVRMTAVEINAGAITARADDAVHVVAFPGDANANRRYDAEDARLVARVGVGLDSGFVLNNPTSQSLTSNNLVFPRFDPIIIGDVTGVDGLSPLDASDLLRRVVGLATPNIPALPTAQSPTDVLLSASTVSPTAAAGTQVGTLTASDPDANDTFTFSLVTGTGSTDNAKFSINGNRLLTATALVATQTSYSVRVRVTDNTNRSFEKVLTITASNTPTNTAPTNVALSATTVAENAAASTTIGNLTSTDANTGDTFTYSIVSVDGTAGSGPFAISGASLRTAGSLNFESKPSYTVRIRTTDQGGLSFERDFTITVTNVNETPTALVLSPTSVADNAAANTTVGTFTTTDGDTNDTFTYTLVTGTGSTDNASFSISGSTLRTATAISFASRTSYSVRVRATDAGGLSTEQVFTITRTGANAAPQSIALSANTVAENVASGSTVATLTTTDPNSTDTHTYTLVAGTGDTDNAAFTIQGNTLRTAAAINFETKNSYTVRIRSTDNGGLSTEQAFTINVTNVNETPTVIALDNNDVDEGVAIGSLVGNFTTTDPDSGDAHTYSLVTGTGSTDNASFTISGNTLRTNTALNAATKSSYSVRVRSTDTAGASTEQTFTITVNNVNQAPTAIALSATTVAENAATGTTVGTFTTTDPDTSDTTFTYSLVSGNGSEDNASFTITGNELKTATALNFETKPSYNIRVRSTDAGGQSFERTLTIAVTNVNEAATTVSLSNSTINNGAASNTLVGTLTNNDPDANNTFTYSLVSGTGSTDNASFTISGSELRTNFIANQATKSSYSVRVRVADALGLSAESVLTITVTGTNSAPTDIALSNATVAENAAADSLVGNLSTTDPNSGDTFTYSLVTGTGSTDNALFSISGSQLRVAGVLNFETKPTYSVRVRSTDAGGQFFEEALTITVTNVNEPATQLTLSDTSVDNGSPTATVVGTFANNDPDAGNTFTYSLVTGTGSTDNASFTIVGNELRTAFVANRATKDSYSVRVRVEDNAGGSFETPFTITVSDTNVAPTAIALSNSSVAENAAAATVVGTLSTTDANSGNTFTYQLVSGTGDTDNGSFTIVGNELRTAASLNFETKSSYSVRVRSTDNGGLSTEQVLTISVTNVNEAATTLSLSSTVLANGAASGTTVGTFTNNDPDTGNTFTYSFVSGSGDTDNGSFTIVGNQLQSQFVANQSTKASYSVRVQVADGNGGTFAQAFTITVNSQNLAPTAIALSASSVNENVPVATPVGTLSTTDPNAGDTHTYGLVAGTGDTDNASFTIVGNELRTAASLNFETKSSYSVRVRSTDNGGLSTEQVLTISVTNVNEAATTLSLSSTVLANGAASGTTVGTFTNNDPDTGNTFTYSFVSGSGDTDNGSFTIVGNQLQSQFVANQSTKASYSVRVQVADGNGGTFAQAFTITVNSQNLAPTAIALSTSSVNENVPVATPVGTLSTTDPNAGDTHTYGLVAGTGDTDNASFTIVGNELRTAATLNFETKNSYSVRVRSTDGGSLTFERTFTITVNDVNEAPTAIALSNSTIAENVAVATVVGTLSSTDVDAGDTHTYELVAGTGDTDNASFAIVGSELRTAAAVNFETKSSYSVRVRSTDGDGLTFERTFTITATDVNEAPTDIALSNSTIAENVAVATVVGTLSSTDVDAGDTHTYELVAGTGDTDNASFAIVGSELRTAAAVNFETKSSYSVRVRSTDGDGLTFERTLTITVTNVNEAATSVTLSDTSVDDGAASGTTVGTFTNNDPDAGNTFTYSLVGGTGDTDNGSFVVSGNQLQTAFVANRATKSSYSVRVRVEDNLGQTFDQVFTVTVAEVSAAPTDLTLTPATVNENVASGTAVGTFATVDANAGDTFTYSFVTGTGDTDNGSFTIVGNELRTNTALNFETKPSYSIRVRTTDSSNQTFDKALTISVTNVNETPTAVQLSSSSVAENVAVGTTVGTLTATDPDSGDTFTFQFVSGTGDTDNASFTIDGNVLKTNTALNFETKASYTVRISATDAAGASVEQAIVINVTNVNETPTALTISVNEVAGNEPVGTIVGAFSTTDPDTAETFTYQLVAGAGDTDNAQFDIVNGQLVTDAVFDQAITALYSVRVRTTDSASNTFEQTFTINVSEDNAAPTAVTISSSNIPDGSAVGTTVGTLDATDTNTNDNHTFELVTGTGDDDNALFEIDGNQLKIAGAIDYNTVTSLSVRIRTTDRYGDTFEQVLTLNVV